MGGGFNFVPKALQSKMKENVEKLRSELLDRMMDYAGINELEDDPDDDGPNLDDLYNDYEERINNFIGGGLRLDDKKLGKLRDDLPMLEDNEGVLDMIKQLYENVQDTETGQRMSNAFDKLKADREKVAIANMMRRRRGEPEIEDRIANKNVLDPDD